MIPFGTWANGHFFFFYFRFSILDCLFARGAGVCLYGLRATSYELRANGKETWEGGVAH